jgi:Ca2+-transporting ATPase
MTEPRAVPQAWHARSIEEVAAELGADPEVGLGADQARARLGRHGPNRLAEARTVGWPRVLARQFTEVLILVLLVAAGIAWAIGEPVDAITILAIVALNGALGFAQEWQAERALAALRQMLAPSCRVHRDGAVVEIDAVGLVPGDLVELEEGDRVPADLRLCRATALAVDESALTGESTPVAKQTAALAAGLPVAERTCLTFLGTVVVRGRGRGLVVGTGTTTEFGRIATLTSSIGEEPTPLQRNLAKLGRQLGLAAVAISVAVALIGWLAGKPLVQMFLTGVSLAVAVVPEGLPAVVTITLALGVRAMARRRALVRRLQAAEALGATTVLCTDKTGTLTRNEMTVRRIWLADGSVEVEGSGYLPAGGFLDADGPVVPAARPDLRAALRTAAACVHASLVTAADGSVEAVGDPTEAALLVAAGKAGIAPPPDEPLAELPFDGSRKRMTLVRAGAAGTIAGNLIAEVKGAPDSILPLCTRQLRGGVEEELDEAGRAAAGRANDDLAGSGLRVLALARRPLDELPDPLEAGAVERDLCLLGLVGMVDPPRPEVAAAVRRAHEAGVRIFVITGDAGPTAAAVAAEIGLEIRTTLRGPELDALADEALGAELALGQVLFARTTPVHKLRLVELLQAAGEVVGMTGDGVNDAPALQRADVGIAMGRRGTDVARAAADLVLTDDDFASIIAAIEEGRRQFESVRKFLGNLLSSNAGEIVALVAALAVGGPLIFLPAHLLWINLVTDGLTSLALGVEPAERELMRRPPRRPGSAILGRPELLWILAQGAWIGLGTFALFELSLAAGVPLERARAVAFTAIVVGELVNAWNYRALRTPLHRIGWLSNPWFTAAWIASFALQILVLQIPLLREAFHLVPLEAVDWLWILAISVPVLAVPELTKIVAERRRGRAARA